MPALVCIFLSVLIFLIYVIRNDVKLLKNDFSFGSGQGVPGCRKQGRLVAVHRLIIVVASLLQSTSSRHTGFSSCRTLGQ